MEIDKQVAARLKRQEILARERPPVLWVIVDEAVLCRPVGGRYVMREQVNHLIEAAERPYVSVQVISSTVGAHRGLSAGAFIIADFEDAPVVGYQETACQGQFVDRREDVETLIDCWDTLVREALPWAASPGSTGGSGKVMDIGHVTWRKASYSGDNGGACVEVASTGQSLVAVRDSKDPCGPELVFDPSMWQTFVHRLQDFSL